MRLQVQLKTGLLQIETDHPDYLKTLTGFGSRLNPKRGFSFVSKVLGKHHAVRPQQIWQTQGQLADKINTLLVQHKRLNKPILVLGFAEMATGLGQGVHAQLGLSDSLYLHSTRYQLDQPVWLWFEESHSHATAHRIYKPQQAELATLLAQVETVVLVDDEFSTGQTLRNVVSQLRQCLPKADTFIGAALLNWISTAQQQQDTQQQIHYVSLHQGRFEFSPDPDCDWQAGQQAIDNAVPSVAENLDAVIPYNFGRLGIQDLQFPISDLSTRLLDQKILVLGSGECMYPAFRIAQHWENQGAEVYLQASSRSPLNIDADITSRLSFIDNYHEDIHNYLYNMGDYEQIYVVYETPKLPVDHDLLQQLNDYANQVDILLPVPEIDV